MARAVASVLCVLLACGVVAINAYKFGQGHACVFCVAGTVVVLAAAAWVVASAVRSAYNDGYSANLRALRELRRPLFDRVRDTATIAGATMFRAEVLDHLLATVTRPTYRANSLGTVDVAALLRWVEQTTAEEVVSRRTVQLGKLHDELRADLDKRSNARNEAP